jgi:hypothetical protein
MVGTRFGDVEAGLQVEDRLAMLDRHHASCGEALAVADAVDLVQDRGGGVAWSEEVRVERVHETIRFVDRAGRRHERLAGDLAAEHSLPVLVGRAPTEDVHLDHLEVEQGDEVVESGAHFVSLASELGRRTAGNALLRRG